MVNRTLVIDDSISESRDVSISTTGGIRLRQLPRQSVRRVLGVDSGKIRVSTRKFAGAQKVQLVATRQNMGSWYGRGFKTKGISYLLCESGLRQTLRLKRLGNTLNIYVRPIQATVA